MWKLRSRLYSQLKSIWCDFYDMSLTPEIKAHLTPVTSTWRWSCEQVLRCTVSESCTHQLGAWVRMAVMLWGRSHRHLLAKHIPKTAL